MNHPPQVLLAKPVPNSFTNRVVRRGRSSLLSLLLPLSAPHVTPHLPPSTVPGPLLQQQLTDVLQSDFGLFLVSISFPDQMIFMPSFKVRYSPSSVMIPISWWPQCLHFLDVTIPSTDERRPDLEFLPCCFFFCSVISSPWPTSDRHRPKRNVYGQFDGRRRQIQVQRNKKKALVVYHPLDSQGPMFAG